MESTQGTDFTRDNTNRARKLRTRGQEKLQAEKQTTIEVLKEGLTEEKWWVKYVRGPADVIRFYELYRPDYPEVLVKAIALRLEGIVEKSRAGQKLTEEEAMYVIRSKKPSEKWDPLVEIQEHEIEAKIKNTIKKFEQM